MVKIEKEKYPSVVDFGNSNAKFYGWAFYGFKRVGCVYKFNDGGYSFIEDFDRKRHNKETRPCSIISRNLKDLKEMINGYYQYMEVQNA